MECTHCVLSILMETYSLPFPECQGNASVRYLTCHSFALPHTIGRQQRIERMINDIAGIVVEIGLFQLHDLKWFCAFLSNGEDQALWLGFIQGRHSEKSNFPDFYVHTFYGLHKRQTDIFCYWTTSWECILMPPKFLHTVFSVTAPHQSHSLMNWTSSLIPTIMYHRQFTFHARKVFFYFFKRPASAFRYGQ